MAGDGNTFTFNPNVGARTEQLNANFRALITCVRLLGANEFSPAQITSDQNNYATVDSNGIIAGVIRLDTDASRTITGLDDGEESRFLLLINVGSNDVVIAHQSGSSDADNRVITQSGANVTVSANGSIQLYYDTTSSRWREVS